MVVVGKNKIKKTKERAERIPSACVSHSPVLVFIELQLHDAS